MVLNVIRSFIIETIAFEILIYLGWQLVNLKQTIGFVETLLSKFSLQKLFSVNRKFLK